MVSLPNLRFPTLGGRQYWADHRLVGAWRLQRHHHTGHWRWLDGRGWRRAWGLGVAAPPPVTDPPDTDHAVLLLHGIARSKDALAVLAWACRARGWTVWDPNYPSCLAALDDLARQVVDLLLAGPVPRRLSFVTHSMGGLVARLVQDRLVREPRWQAALEAGATCMLFPPNRGAAKARRWHRKGWYRLILGPSGQGLTPWAAAALPTPRQRCLVIAGGRGDSRGRSRFIPGDDDGTVGVLETVLPGCALQVIDVGHTFGMNDPRVVATVLAWLERSGTAVTADSGIVHRYRPCLGSSASEPGDADRRPEGRFSADRARRAADNAP